MLREQPVHHTAIYSMHFSLHVSQLNCPDISILKPLKDHYSCCVFSTRFLSKDSLLRLTFILPHLKLSFTQLKLTLTLTLTQLTPHSHTHCHCGPGWYDGAAEQVPDIPSCEDFADIFLASSQGQALHTDLAQLSTVHASAIRTAGDPKPRRWGYPTSFRRQVLTLVHRTAISVRRDRSAVNYRIAASLVLGALLGELVARCK